MEAIDAIRRAKDVLLHCTVNGVGRKLHARDITVSRDQTLVTVSVEGFKVFLPAEDLAAGSDGEWLHVFPRGRLVSDNHESWMYVRG